MSAAGGDRALGSIQAPDLAEFERGFRPRRPELSAIPARVLGFGEISTVLEIQAKPFAGLAFKRMPMFETEREVSDFLQVHQRYLDALGGIPGIQLVPSATQYVRAVSDKRWVLYIVQERVPDELIANRAIGRLSRREAINLVRAALQAAQQVFQRNHAQQGSLEVGFDAQISNWAVAGLSSDQQSLSRPFGLRYLDTSSPLLRIAGVEQLNPELFLRSAPFFLVWILRLLFLQDVLTRYYDFRKVAIDLAANFYKEGMPELVPEAVREANLILQGSRLGKDIAPIEIQEVRRYYREDAWIWRLYLAFRKVDRALRSAIGQQYPYSLPATVQR